MRKSAATKFVAMIVVVTAMVGSGAAQKVKTAAAVHPAVVSTSGAIPYYTDTTGDLGSSLIFENSVSSYIGIGTQAPATTLDISGTNPTLRVDNYSNTLGDSPNFNFISSRGTAATPAATQSGDNLGQFAAAGFNGTAFPGSKVKVTFVATETWGLNNNGTAMSFQTTANGSTSRTERMRIDNTGNVGIGTSTPANPLSVNGVIQSMTGGFLFPDSSVQTTAGVVLGSDSSITVSGTNTAPTVAVNPAVVQKRVSGTCTGMSAVQSVTASGGVNCGTIGAGGSLANVPVVVANTNFTGGYGLGTPQTIYTASASGFYRVSVYMNVPTTGTCASAPCAGEAIAVQWNDGVSTTALNTANCNLVTACGSAVVTPVWVASGQAITAYGQSYGTGSAPGGTPGYTAYVLVEQM